MLVPELYPIVWPQRTAILDDLFNHDNVLTSCKAASLVQTAASLQSYYTEFVNYHALWAIKG